MFGEFAGCKPIFFIKRPISGKCVSTTTGTFINAGYYKVLLSAEDMNGLAFDALEIQ